MEKFKYIGETSQDGKREGFGVLFEADHRTDSYTRHLSYEEVMRTAEFDSCGRVIHTGPAYETTYEEVDFYRVGFLGWWKDDEAVKSWDVKGIPWTGLRIHHEIDGMYDTHSVYEAPLGPLLQAEYSKVKEFTVYYKIVGAGKDGVKVEYGNYRKGYSLETFTLPLDGSEIRFERSGGMYHDVHRIKLIPE